MSIYEKIAKNKNLKKYMERIQESATLDEDYISTGIATLNILYSGKVNGGIPKYKISMIAGETQSGKSLQTVYLVKQALKKGMEVVFIDTEYALNDVMLENFGLKEYIDNRQLLIIQENDIGAIKSILANLEEDLTFDEKKNLLLVIDSWGGLINRKILDDALVGKDVADLQTTRAKNSLAGMLLSLYPITIFVSNHTYTDIGSFIPTQGGVLSGGSKIQYVSSAIVKISSQKKDKEDKEVIGKIVTAIVEKGRYVKPQTKLQYLIRFDGGIHPYYGLLDIALEAEYVIKPKQGWYQRKGIDDIIDRKWREKEIWENSREFFGELFKKTDFLQYIEKKYRLGSSNGIETMEEIEFSEKEGSNEIDQF